MSRPSRALQIAQPAVGVLDCQIACEELPGEETCAVVREADFHAGRAIANLRVDPGVILADAPKAFGHRVERAQFDCGTPGSPVTLPVVVRPAVAGVGDPAAVTPDPPIAAVAPEPLTVPAALDAPCPAGPAC
jgi:hypothetical protein